MDSRPLAPPVTLPHRSHLPVALSIAHSGREMPDWLIADARCGDEALLSLGDPLVDRLAWRASAAGLGAVVVQSPRAAIDCNRAVDDLDPALVAGAPPIAAGMRARHGIGLIPSRTRQHGHLWRRRIGMDEVMARIGQVHRPFHTAVAAMLDDLVAEGGSALLLDCHSMPPRAGQAELVIGDRHGTTADGWLVAEAVACARSLGWSVALNDPYAGGHIVERHGRPAEGRHALQLEFDRRCYLADDGASPGPGFDRAARLLHLLAVRLGTLLRGATALAAE